MGLSICYNLTSMQCDAAQAQRLVRDLQAYAQGLGFDSVSPVFHETDADPHEDQFGALYPGRRFIRTARDLPDHEPPPPREPLTDEQVDAEAQAIVDLFDENRQRQQMGLPPEEPPDFSAELIDATDGGLLDVHPLESFFFWASNPGAEPLIVGLARYPAVIDHRVKGVTQQFETGLGVGWHWEGFCKTQYAGMPDAGGPDHFIRAHTAAVHLLDRAVALGIRAEVHDDSGYWADRNEDRLTEQLHEWNAMMASVAGRIKDSGRDVQAPILDHPTFEHLEARGEAALKRFGQQRGHDGPGEE